MQHKIDSKTYTLRLTGTIGVVYATERMLGRTPDSTKQQDMIALLYKALVLSGNEMPALEDFEALMTIKLFKALAEDFWTQWNDIEGTVPEGVKQKASSKKGES